MLKELVDVRITTVRLDDVVEWFVDDEPLVTTVGFDDDARTLLIDALYARLGPAIEEGLNAQRI